MSSGGGFPESVTQASSPPKFSNYENRWIPKVSYRLTASKRFRAKAWVGGGADEINA